MDIHYTRSADGAEERGGEWSEAGRVAPSRHVSSGFHFGRKEVILYSPSSVQSTRPLVSHSRSSSPAPTCSWALIFPALFSSARSDSVIYSPCEVAVFLRHRSVRASLHSLSESVPRLRHRDTAAVCIHSCGDFTVVMQNPHVIERGTKGGEGRRMRRRGRWSLVLA